ncbi:MAG TPA: hypothetical protein VGB07_36355 [Blastocatellia bacterium]
MNADKWEAVEVWLNEMTAWANAEVAIHPERRDALSEWLSAMKQPYLQGVRSDSLYLRILDVYREHCDLEKEVKNV